MAKAISAVGLALLLGAALGGGQAEAQGTAAATRCASAYHERFAAIEAGELAAYRTARATVDAPDPALPGRMLFAAPRRPGLDAEAAGAVRLASGLVRAQGRTSFARDANTRWIAERIREDLTDYLRQGPSPFLCAGTAPYLSKLREYASQGAPSPASILEGLVAQKRTASASLDAAFGAMRPAPVPRFAPADRPAGPPVEGMRLAMEIGLGEPAAAPSETRRLAQRAATTQISDSLTDPDLPPLGGPRARALSTPADLMRATTALLGTAERNGFLSSAVPARAGPTIPGRPVLSRLAGLRAHLESPAGRVADPRVRPALVQALADIEMLDYLVAAGAAPADPLTAAMHATMDAIEAAQAQSCGCAR